MSTPARTNAAAVQGILGGTAPTSNWDGLTDVTQFIAVASQVVDQVITQAANKATVFGGIALDATTAEMVERYLAAHFYCVLDPLYTSKNTSNASGNFQRTSAGIDSPFETTDYGRQACAIDFSGMLRALSRRQVAGGFWAGLNLSDKPDLSDANDVNGGGNTNATGSFGSIS